MVYIYGKSKGEKTYYYLRASARKGDKVQTKDIAYLGDDPKELLARIKSLPSQYAEAIRKSHKTIERFLATNHALELVQAQDLKADDYLGKELTEETAACKLHYEKTFKTLDPQTKEEVLQNFAIEFAYNTTSLEGNTITLQQAEKLLLEARTPRNKTLREVYDVQNTSELFHTLYNELPGRITHELVQEVHEKLLRNIDQRTGYRTQEIRVWRSRFDASPAPYVQTDMNLLLRWLEEQQGKLHPLVLGVLFHHKFEKIHPFMDGNGRTGRVLLNIILLQHGHPPLIITKRNRERYLAALAKADAAELTASDATAYTSLVRFVAQEYVKNYWHVFL